MANEKTNSMQISVTSRREGFRRAGFAFGKEPTVFAPGELSETALKLLKDEAMLTVTETGVTKELTPAERKEAIIAAIGTLDPNNGDVWSRDGKPNVSAITAVVGWPVSAAERNEAWLEMQE